VWDTGVGIAPEKIEMIFHEFYQIDNPERDRTRGLGMGLAIVQRLCNLLEHSLQVRSTLGHGSVFRVIVPAGDLGTGEAPPLEADTLPPRTEARVTVLLIDDERAIREATRELLRPMQVDVMVAGTIAEAVELAKAGRGADRPDPVRLALTGTGKRRRRGARGARGVRRVDSGRADHRRHLARVAEAGA